MNSRGRSGRQGGGQAGGQSGVWIAAVLAGLAGGALGSAATLWLARPATDSADDRQVETVIHDYLMKHPEVLPKAMGALQAREAAEFVKQNAAALTRPYGSAWQGAENPDVTVVEFYDYACGYCKRSVDTIQRLIAADPKVRVVYRELPVLAPESETAAFVSLAAAQKGDFVAFHQALYAAGAPDAATLAAVASRFGLDPNAPPTPEMKREIATNQQFAQALDMSGTPSWIIGDKVYPGMLTYEQLRKAVAEARASASGHTGANPS